MAQALLQARKKMKETDLAYAFLVSSRNFKNTK